ncbi:hypothetical protein Q1695_000509 [Nippostrongylus brasiliensis]|nr:hypothetical protein Q1695_000509 [Nippostrongylus brasiliensis]
MSPCHKSRETMKDFEERGVSTLSWPAESPDLNPIELVWGNMKADIRKRNIKNLDDLKVAALQYWRTLAPELCTNYIAGMRNKLERVSATKRKEYYRKREGDKF